jgi:hypothetical protein
MLWADLPALLLASVSAITVTTGAQLVRGQNPVVMLALGIGVAGATFLLEKLLVERLNAIRPRQSLWALAICWLPLLLFASALATFATFSWLVPEIARHDLEDSRRTHWIRESEKASAYVVSLKTALRRQADAAQSDIDVARRHIAAARRDGEPYDAQPLAELQRRAAAVRELQRRIGVLTPLPIDLPSDASVARQQLERVFGDLADVHATAMLVLARPPSLPVYEPFSPPSTDLQSVLAEETKKRSWRAITAWSTALWVELLPLLALWRGGRRIPLAVRVSQWRSQIRQTNDALLGRGGATPLPIVIEPLQVRGIVRVALPAEYTLDDCTPLLEEAVESLHGVLGAYRLQRISNANGEEVAGHLPLVPQLNGAPLVLSVVEGDR